MPLTPQDVHSKVFGPTRFRRGYDEAEVDAFLDEVEAELVRLHAEIDALRASESAGQGTTAGLGSANVAAEGAAASSEAQAASPEIEEPVVDAEFDGPPGGPAEPTATAWADAQAEPYVVADATPGSTAGEAQAAAASVRSADDTGDLEQRVARTLVLAQRAADEAVRDAESHAEQVRSAAQGEAEQVRTAAQSEADRIRQEAAQEAERARAELERSRSAVEGEVEQLRAFEREYRTRLRAYLELQLQQLDTGNSSLEGGQTAAITGTPASDEPYSSNAAGPALAGVTGAAGSYASGTAAGYPSRDQDAHQDAHQVQASGLPTSDLPPGDPAAVPSVPDADHGSLPSSIPVTEGSDSAAAGGVRRDLVGEELRHEPRDLHDDL